MGITTQTTMKLEHFHDFYYLEAIKAGIATRNAVNPENAFRHSTIKLTEATQDAIFDIVPNMALRTFVYLYAACFGEARHSRSEQARDSFLCEAGVSGRKEAYLKVLDFEPTKRNITTLVNIFSQPWRGAFGGKAWYDIAEALNYYFKVSPEAFIDHVIDLEHNCGTVFNKSDARYSIYFDVEYPGHLREFLNYKFAKNILTQSPGYGTFHRVTPRVYRLIARYCTLFRLPFPSWIRSDLKTLGDYTVTWGNKNFTIESKWAKWATIGRKNEPNIANIISLVSLDEMYPQSQTKREFLASVESKKREAITLMNGHSTKELLDKLENKVQRVIQWGLKLVKVEPKATTYPVLPCKVKECGSHYVLQVAVPYEDYGTPTDYGFKIELQNLWMNSAILQEYTTQGYDGEPGYADCYLTKDHTLILNYGSHRVSLHNNQLEAFLS